MTPKRIITARDLVAKRTSAEVDAIYQKALEGAYRDQQELLKKAKRFSK